jgi:hypothetical protein
MLIFLAACTTSGPPAASGGSAAPDTADISDDTSVRAATSGSCDVPAGGDIGFDTVYAGSASYVDDASWQGETIEDHVSTTQADWDAWTATFTMDSAVGSVDFSNHRVAAGLVVVPNTCGLSVVTTTATQVTGQPVHVELGVEDSSGGCDTNCSMVGQMIVALSVPTRPEGEPTVCIRRVDGC